MDGEKTDVGGGGGDEWEEKVRKTKNKMAGDSKQCT